jgi:hypothetical protein
MNMRIILINATKPAPKARLATVAPTFVTPETVNPSALRASNVTYEAS